MMRIKAMEFEKDYQKGLLVCKLTEHDLNNLLEESYNEGYKDGYKDAVTTKLPYKDKDGWEVSYVREESTTVSNTISGVNTSPAVVTQINNDIGHGSVSISSVKPDPNLRLVGNKDETDFVVTDPPTSPLDMSHVKLPTSLPITYTNIPWITEGEPDETGDYLITIEDEDFNGHVGRYVEIETYYKENEPDNGFENYEDSDVGFGAGWQTLYKVLAWAPIMIEPYYDKKD